MNKTIKNKNWEGGYFNSDYETNMNMMCGFRQADE